MRWVILVMMTLLSWIGVRAQSIFQSELERAAAVVQHQRGGFVVVRLAVFKQEALLYLREKTDNQDGETRKRWLDNQAYYLADFLGLYYHLLCDTQLTASNHQEIRDWFKQASLGNPAFYNEEDPKALRFVEDSSQPLTPFSLDSDWEKSFGQVLRQMQNSSYADIVQTFSLSPTR